MGAPLFIWSWMWILNALKNGSLNFNPIDHDQNLADFSYSFFSLICINLIHQFEEDPLHEHMIKMINDTFAEDS